MGSRLNDLRIFGLPAQFVVVVAVSLALTIYFGAYAADARVNARAAQSDAAIERQFDFGASASNTAAMRLSGSITQRPDGSAAADASAAESTERQAWEYMFLIACPLH